MTDRVLLVEDHEPWRRYFASALPDARRWQIVGEASDGLEAVQKAEELKPDLILLDVGLPGLNGIQAARRILAMNPGSRILFVSEQQSWEVAEAALSTGARGYLVKSDAARELLPAMEAVTGGRRFISTRLAGRVAGTSDEPVAPEAHRHEVGFYSEEASLVDEYTGSAEAALAAGHASIAVVADSRRDRLHKSLHARGVDVDRAIKDGRFIPLDVADALSSVMVDGWPDEARFWNVTHPLLLRAASASKGERPRIAACGECAPGLLREGRAAAAIRLEQLWDQAASTYDMDVFCGYLSDRPRSGEQSHVLQEICAVHSAVRSR